MSYVEIFAVWALIHCAVTFTGQPARFLGLRKQGAFLLFHCLNGTAIAVGLVGPELWPDMHVGLVTGCAGLWLAFTLLWFVKTPKQVDLTPTLKSFLRGERKGPPGAR